MPNRRRIGYMPSRRFDENKNVERQKARRGRLLRSRRSGTRDGDTDNLEEWTKDELYALARDRGIKGRSMMTKARLVRSLRETDREGGTSK